MLYREMSNILSKMLCIRNRNTRILVYAAIIFVSLGVSLLLIHQADCQMSDGGSVFCRGFTADYSMIALSVMTLGGTMVVFAFLEPKTFDATGMALLGFSILLVGFGLVGIFFIDFD